MQLKQKTTCQHSRLSLNSSVANCNFHFNQHSNQWHHVLAAAISQSGPYVLPYSAVNLNDVFCGNVLKIMQLSIFHKCLGNLLHQSQPKVLSSLSMFFPTHYKTLQLHSVNLKSYPRFVLKKLFTFSNCNITEVLLVKQKLNKQKQKHQTKIKSENAQQKIY